MDAIAELEQRLAQYDAERYPVQHAVTRFHLGSLLTDAGRVEEAVESLARAVELFDSVALPVEHAKSLNALGAARRLAGEPEPAAESFERAARLFEAAGLDLERGAALFNLGLVRRTSSPRDAVDCFRRAAGLLDGAQQAAALRELGSVLLELGEVGEAVDALEKAASKAGLDLVGYGGALNALGLAQLAAGLPDAAVESFRGAVGAHPRSVRPAEFAMAKANLALAHERRGDAPRARLAARQALGAAEPPEPVAEQAGGVLARLGPAADDLLNVLRQEMPEQEALVREEVMRSADAPLQQQRADALTWIVAPNVELVEAWLGALLELPPTALERTVRATLDALIAVEPETRERFRGNVGRASARFHVPQLLRLEEIFARVAAEVGVPWN